MPNMTNGLISLDEVKAAYDRESKKRSTTGLFQWVSREGKTRNKYDTAAADFLFVQYCSLKREVDEEVREGIREEKERDRISAVQKFGEGYATDQKKPFCIYAKISTMSKLRGHCLKHGYKASRVISDLIDTYVDHLEKTGKLM